MDFYIVKNVKWINVLNAHKNTITKQEKQKHTQEDDWMQQLIYLLKLDNICKYCYSQNIIQEINSCKHSNFVMNLKRGMLVTYKNSLINSSY